jgi:hypothetical protein
MPAGWILLLMRSSPNAGLQIFSARHGSRKKRCED